MQATRSVASNPIVRYVADALRFYMEFHAAYDGFYGAFIHDPLAVAAALDRRLVTTEAWFVDVETRGELTTGMTVADRRGLTGSPPNLEVAVTANVTEFLDRLVERVGGLALYEPTPFPLLEHESSRTGPACWRRDLPVLYMLGAQSLASSRGVGRVLTQTLRNVSVIEFSELPHTRPVTHAELVNDAIAAFLASHTVAFR